MDKCVSVIALITARGGSKGLPRKNILPAGGKPLIAWTIEAARKSRVRSVIVSTDDEEIAQIARQCGAEVPFLRPSELAMDDTPHADVVLHAAEYLRDSGALPDAIALLQPTSPLLLASDLDGAIEAFTRSETRSLVSVCEPATHPFLAVTLDDGGRVHRFVDRPSRDMRRQEMPNVYAFNGAITIVSSDYLLATRNLTERDPMAYRMPVERSLDVDSAWEFLLVDLLLTQRQS